MPDVTSKEKQTEVATELTLTLPAEIATSQPELVHTIGSTRCSRRSRLSYQHDPQRGANRHSSTQDALVLEDDECGLGKPRVRSVDGQEVTLPM